METQQVEVKAILGEIRASVQSIVEAQRKQQQQVDAIDLASQRRDFAGYSPAGDDLLAKALGESDELRRMVEVGKGKAVIRRV